MSELPAPPPPPSLDELRCCGADALLSEPTPAKAYDEMWSRLFAAAKAALPDQPRAAALDYLAKICSMMLDPDEPAALFKAMLVTPAGRSMLPEDLMPADIDVLAELAPTVRHPWLRARLADLVWLIDRRKGIRFAHLAIEAYREPAIGGEDWDRGAIQCRQRAIQLALSTGKDGGVVASEIAGELLDAFWHAIDAGNQTAAMRYLWPLQVQGLARDEAAQIADTLEAIARRNLLEGDPFGAQRIAESALAWFGRARDKERCDAVQILIAESWVAQGEKDGSGISRHHCYAKAIDAYQRVPARYLEQLGAAGAIAQLRARLPEAGLDMLGRMKTVSHRFDISDLVRDAVGKVQGLPPTEALFTFCRIAPWPGLEALRAEAEIPLNSFAAMFSTTSVDGDGRVIAHEDGVGDAASRERRLAAEMVKVSAHRADLSAHGIIGPALDMIRQQFHLSLYDFYTIAQLSALVPADRANLVAKGLYAGYCSDFIQAIHILVPQFEHMVRMVLKEAGAQTTSRQDGIEMELGLSKLVDLPEMEKCFGESLTFTIRALMCKPLGPNLRNQVAHGLAGANLCNSGAGVYTWWLILALVVDGYHMMHRAEEANDPANAAED